MMKIVNKISGELYGKLEVSQISGSELGVKDKILPGSDFRHPAK
jgi:hypothetical protein